jgi:hypothetical protein
MLEQHSKISWIANFLNICNCFMTNDLAFLKPSWNLFHLQDFLIYGLWLTYTFTDKTFILLTKIKICLTRILLGLFSTHQIYLAYLFITIIAQFLLVSDPNYLSHSFLSPLFFYSFYLFFVRLPFHFNSQFLYKLGGFPELFLIKPHFSGKLSLEFI